MKDRVPGVLRSLTFMFFLAQRAKGTGSAWLMPQTSRHSHPVGSLAPILVRQGSSRRWVHPSHGGGLNVQGLPPLSTVPQICKSVTVPKQAGDRSSFYKLVTE